MWFSSVFQRCDLTKPPQMRKHARDCAPPLDTKGFALEVSNALPTARVESLYFILLIYPFSLSPHLASFSFQRQHIMQPNLHSTLKLAMQSKLALDSSCPPPQMPRIQKYAAMLSYFIFKKQSLIGQSEQAHLTVFLPQPHKGRVHIYTSFFRVCDAGGGQQLPLNVFYCYCPTIFETGSLSEQRARQLARLMPSELQA